MAVDNTNINEAINVVEKNIFDKIATDAKYIGANVPVDEIARLAESNDMGDAEINAIAEMLSYLATKKKEKAIQMKLNTSRIPQKSPKTFDNFDFGRLKGKGCKALSQLPTLSNLYAQRNLTLIGPEGVGKSHLARAYGRECCIQGFQAYYIKTRELNDKLIKAVKTGTTTDIINQLVRPPCLIIDDIGRCKFDKECTELLFHVVDKRIDKEGPNLIFMTSNFMANKWDEFFTGSSTLLSALDRLFDTGTVFMIEGSSYRGAGLETYSVEAVPSAVKLPATK